MKINLNNLFSYILLTIIFHLSGSYFGDSFNYINIFLILLLMLNIIHFLLTVKFIYFNQKFSTEHPQKGDLIEYNNYIKNSLPIITSPITVEYNEHLKLDKTTFILGSKKNLSICQNFTLPFRGVYEVGYKDIYIRDILNILQLKRPIWRRTFYVYPKLKELNINSNGKGYKSDNNIDITGINRDSLENLRDYLPGSRSSLISWKHFASRGEPYIKKFSSLENRNLSIFIDRSRLSENRLGPVDDKSLEISVSIINSSLLNSENVFIANSNTLIKSVDGFKEYYKSTVFEEFNLHEKNVEKEFINSDMNYMDTIIVITPMENSFFLSKELYIKYPKMIVIIVSKLMTSEKIRSIESLIENNRINEDRIIWVK